MEKVPKVEIRKGLPIPRSSKLPKYQFQFDDLVDIGDSFILPYTFRARLRSSAHSYMEKTGKGLVVRVFVDGSGRDMVGCWRVLPEQVEKKKEKV
jgi:hypothetical protein